MANLTCPSDTASYLRLTRRQIVEEYKKNPTGCGGSFGEILCYEIHSSGLTFVQLAEKWNISLPTLGDLIKDHCDRLQPLPLVDFNYKPE